MLLLAPSLGFKSAWLLVGSSVGFCSRHLGLPWSWLIVGRRSWPLEPGAILLWTGDWILYMSVLSPPMGRVLAFLALLVIYGLPGSQCNEWAARLWSTWLTTTLPAHQHRRPWLSCSKQLIQDLITEKGCDLLKFLFQVAEVEGTVHLPKEVATLW